MNMPRFREDDTERPSSQPSSGGGNAQRSQVRAVWDAVLAQRPTCPACGAPWGRSTVAAWPEQGGKEEAPGTIAWILVIVCASCGTTVSYRVLVRWQQDSASAPHPIATETAELRPGQQPGTAAPILMPPAPLAQPAQADPEAALRAAGLTPAQVAALRALRERWQEQDPETWAGDRPGVPASRQERLRWEFYRWLYRTSRLGDDR